MALLGRSDELQRLGSLAATHQKLVVVGVPGVGRRSMAAAFIATHPAWTLQEGSPDNEVTFTIRVDTRLPASGVGVLRLCPLKSAHALELLRTRLVSLGAEVPNDLDLAHLLKYADGLPRALEGLARLVAAEDGARALRRLQQTPLVRLLVHDEAMLRWRDELLKMTQELPIGARTALNLLSRLQVPFGDRIQALLGAEQGAEVTLIERGIVIRRDLDDRTGERQVLRCIAALETERAAPELRARFSSWVFHQAHDTKRREQVRAELIALFHQDVSRRDEASVARRAGTLLAPLIADRGPIRPHLKRLIEVDGLAIDRDVETECAIAQLRLVIGQPEAMWRRLEPVLENAGAFTGRAQHLAGSCQRRLGHSQVAKAHYDNAVRCFETADPHHELGMVLSNLGGLAVESGDASAARKIWARALRHFVAEADLRAEAIVLGDLGLLDHEGGDYESAQRRYERALTLHTEVGNMRFAGIVCCDLGELALLRGSPKEAAAHLHRGTEHLRSTEDSRQVTLGEAALALAEGACGDMEGAKRRLAGVRDHAPEDLWPVMDLYSAAIMVHEANAARRVGDSIAEAALLTRVHAALTQPISTPDEARRVAQVLRAELRRYEQRAGWAIAHDAGFFVTPNDARVDLSRRRVSRRLLGALLDHRLAHPGEILRLEDLLRAGWPGQRILQAAARNRLHVALSSLRKLGVDALLLRRGEGYLLDPDTEIAVVR